MREARLAVGDLARTVRAARPAGSPSWSRNECRLWVVDTSTVTPRPLVSALRAKVVAVANGTTVNMLPAEALQRPAFALPLRTVLAAVDALVAPLLERIEANEDENETLAELRDTLLPGLVSGTLRVGPEVPSGTE